jgi:hypothetical protein
MGRKEEVCLVERNAQMLKHLSLGTGGLPLWDICSSLREFLAICLLRVSTHTLPIHTLYLSPP